MDHHFAIDRAENRDTIEHLEALAALPKLIPDAILVRSRSDTKDQAGVNQVHRFYAAMRMNGVLHAVKLTVKKHAGKTLGFEESEVFRRYDHQIEKPVPDGRRKATTPKGVSPSSTSGSDIISIQELLEGINDAAGRPYFEAIDELYQSAFHGGPHRFHRFNAEHIGTGEGGKAFS